MKRNYYLTGYGGDGMTGVGPMLHLSYAEAVQWAKDNGCADVEKVKLTTDCILRLHNGKGGYVEESKVVWKNPAVQQ